MPFGRIVRVDRQQASARRNPIDVRVVQAAQQVVERAVLHEEYLLRELTKFVDSKEDRVKINLWRRTYDKVVDLAALLCRTVRVLRKVVVVGFECVSRKSRHLVGADRDKVVPERRHGVLQQRPEL